MPPHVAFAIRPNPGFWEFVKVNSDDLSVEAITVTDFLKFKELVFDEDWYVLYLEKLKFYLFLFIFAIKLMALQGKRWKCIGSGFRSIWVLSAAIDFIFFDRKWDQFCFKVCDRKAKRAPGLCTASCGLSTVIGSPRRGMLEMNYLELKFWC